MARILVVDDDKNIRAVFTRFLLRHDYQVVCASTVNEALGYLEDLAFDIILLDIQMPGGCGDRLYQKIRLDTSTSRVIVSSVYSIEEQKRTIPEADDYFDKSDGLMVLLEKINAVQHEKKGGVQ